MRRSALRRAASAGIVLVAAALLLNLSSVRFTFAVFNGETTNDASTFAGGWVGASSAATATASGYNMSLAWTPGTHGPVTSQALRGVDNLTNPDCTGAAYAPITTFADNTTASYNDANRATAGTSGHWFCYELLNSEAGGWTAATTFQAQIGLVATSVTVANAGGTANSIEKSDTIAIGFNQKPNLTAGIYPTCVISTTTIIIGDTTHSNCTGATAADAYNFGKLVVSGATFATTVKYTTTTIAFSTAAPWIATVTIAGSNTKSGITGTPTWTFTPFASIVSANAPAATVCSSGTNCLPTTTSSF